MTDGSDTLYEGREQTQVKHFILRKYLERFAYKIGSRWNAITYVDCFSGPWQSQSASFEDTSFSIALQELRRARDAYAQRNRTIRLRCLFLEKDREAFAKLQEYAYRQKDVTIRATNSDFEAAIPEILRFVREGGSDSFPFFFVDPKGWSGIYITTITPLLQVNPGELLINFMTDPIRRFLSSPQEPTRQSFRDLFGSDLARDRLRGLHGQDLEDAAIALYADALREFGRFDYVCCATILYPTKNKTYFNLLYATRHPAGAQVFKEVEKKSVAVMQRGRAQAISRRRTQTTGNLELPGVASDKTHLEPLRRRYFDQAREAVLKKLRDSGRVLYDDAWAETTRLPLVWESDLKAWIAEWKRTGLGLELAPDQRVPKLGKRNFLVWKTTVRP